METAAETGVDRPLFRRLSGVQLVLKTAQNLLGLTLLGRVRVGHNSLDRLLGEIDGDGGKQVDGEVSQPQNLSQQRRIGQGFPGLDGTVQMRDGGFTKPNGGTLFRILEATTDSQVGFLLNLETLRWMLFWGASVQRQ